MFFDVHRGEAAVAVRPRVRRRHQLGSGGKVREGGREGGGRKVAKLKKNRKKRRKEGSMKGRTDG